MAVCAMNKQSSPVNAMVAVAQVRAARQPAANLAKPVRRVAKAPAGTVRASKARTATVAAMVKVKARASRATAKVKASKVPDKALARLDPLVDKATARAAAVVWVAAPKAQADQTLSLRISRTVVTMMWLLGSSAKPRWPKAIRSCARNFGRSIACIRREADLNWMAVS